MWEGYHHPERDVSHARFVVQASSFHGEGESKAGSRLRIVGGISIARTTGSRDGRPTKPPGALVGHPLEGPCQVDTLCTGGIILLFSLQGFYRTGWL